MFSSTSILKNKYEERAFEMKKDLRDMSPKAVYGARFDPGLNEPTVKIHV